MFLLKTKFLLFVSYFLSFSSLDFVWERNSNLFFFVFLQVYKIHVINENKEYEIEKRFSAFKELHEAVGIFIFKKIDVINIFTLVRRWIWSLYGSFISQN